MAGAERGPGRRLTVMLALIRLTLWLMLLLALAALALAAWRAMTASPLQVSFLSRLGIQMQFQVKPGTSDAIRFPLPGPFDMRLGYSASPADLREFRPD